MFGTFSQALDDVGERTDSHGAGDAVFEDRDLGRGEFLRGIDVLDFVDEEFSWKGQRALKTLLWSAEKPASADVVFLEPGVLDAFVALRVVEAGQSISDAPIRSTPCDGFEFGTAVGATGDLAFVPQCPLRRLMKGHVAAFAAHVDVPVVLAFAVREREESGHFEVEAVGAGGEEWSNRSVLGWLPQGSEECPVGEVVGWSSPEWHSRTDALDA